MRSDYLPLDINPVFPGFTNTQYYNSYYHHHHHHHYYHYYYYYYYYYYYHNYYYYFDGKCTLISQQGNWPNFCPNAGTQQPIRKGNSWAMN